MRSLRRLRELSSLERWLLLQAFWMLPLARLSLALCGFNRTNRLFLRLAPVRCRMVDAREGEAIALATARMVRVAAVNGACVATCLPRSVVTATLLRGAGLDPTLQLGARKKDGVLEAHAWVVLGAVTIGDDTGDHGEPFSPFSIAQPRDEHHTAAC